MSLTPTNVKDNPFTPGIAAEMFIPDQLFAGQFQPVSTPITVASGAAVLPRGTVLGKVTATGKYIESLAGAADGSQTPVAILADQADPTGGDVLSGAYLTGEFNSNALTFDASWTVATLTAAMRPYGIFIKTMNAGLSNSDPS
jgi:hypothetical protein